MLHTSACGIHRDRAAAAAVASTQREKSRVSHKVLLTF